MGSPFRQGIAQALFERLDDALWFAYAGIAIALVGAVLTAWAIGARRRRWQRILAALVLVGGMAVAALAAGRNEWWPLILTMHLALGSVLVGVGAAHHHVNRTGPFSRQVIGRDP